MYLLEIDHQYQNHLGQIRHWAHLKIASDAGKYWIKELTDAEVNSIEVKSIPFKNIYSLTENKLVPYGSRLPIKKISTSLLWTPIDKGLPVTLPKFNHNFFGIHQELSLKLVRVEQTREAKAMLLPTQELLAYVEQAPTIRLNNLKWVLLSKKQALVVGTPLLPLPADTLWLNQGFLLPSGFDLDLAALTGVLADQLNPERNLLVVWNMDNSFTTVSPDQFQPLSLSSVRLTYKELTQY